MRSAVITTFSLLLLLFLTALIGVYAQTFELNRRSTLLNETNITKAFLKEYGRAAFFPALYKAYQRAVNAPFKDLNALEDEIKSLMDDGLQKLRDAHYTDVVIDKVKLGMLNASQIQWNVTYKWTRGGRTETFIFVYNDSIVGFPDPYVKRKHHLNHSFYFLRDEPKVEKKCSGTGVGWFFGEVGTEIALSDDPSKSACIIFEPPSPSPSGSSPTPSCAIYAIVPEDCKTAINRCLEWNYAEHQKTPHVLLLNGDIYCIQKLRDAAICQNYWVWEDGRSFLGRFLEDSTDDPCVRWRNCDRTALVSFVWANGHSITPAIDVGGSPSVVIKGLPGAKEEDMCNNPNSFFGTLSIPEALADDLRIPSDMRGCS